MPFKLPSFTELNKTQKLIINLLPKSDKLAVVGGPGTGKTILALEAAAQNSKEKKKCLILSYSTLLRDQIKCIAKTYKLSIDNIEVNSYLKWFWKELQELGCEDPTILQPDGQKFIYDLEKIENFLSSQDKSKLKKYDYLFIDEAQDVQDGLIKYFALFCDKTFVTFDDCQKVGNEKGNDSFLTYDHSNILTDLKIGDKFFDLIDNYRNTTQIETAAKLLFSSYDLNDVTLTKVTSKTHGAKPRIVECQKHVTYEDVANYIVDHYDKSKSAAVLFDTEVNDRDDVFNSLKDSIIGVISNRKENINFYYKYGEKKKNINDTNALNEGLFLMSFKASKGLEFDDVFILSRATLINDFKKRNAFYVAFTRAKSMSYVIFDNSSLTNKNELYCLMTNNRYLFDTDEIRGEKDE